MEAGNGDRIIRDDMPDDEEENELEDKEGEEGNRKGPGSCKAIIKQWVTQKWNDDLVGLNWSKKLVFMV
jgi:hypothetical protein